MDVNLAENDLFEDPLQIYFIISAMILVECHFYFNLQFEGSGREEKRLDHCKGIGEDWFE